ncbi:unnamed protein product [Chondrus crispus]|uniref:Uncharacterized protein n=1 Tax=Chondrus crispus TaxID=2769 RepID=R7QKP2_CHOCR|nr:unnamed protein product [Chondrus crispus]CDF39082.1 unnamed protein product [Chondrus crispus]|eukprot:XP_005718993.1 unnamed protein product [Chondrus crispus]
MCECPCTSSCPCPNNPKPPFHTTSSCSIMLPPPLPTSHSLPTTARLRRYTCRQPQR